MKNILIDADSFSEDFKSSNEEPSTIYYVVSSNSGTVRKLQKKFRADKKRRVLWKSDLTREKIEDIEEVWIGSFNEEALKQYSEKNRSVKRVFFKESLKLDESLEGFVKKSSTDLERDSYWHSLDRFKFRITDLTSYSAWSKKKNDRRLPIEEVCFVTFAEDEEHLPLSVVSDDKDVQAIKKICFASSSDLKAPEDWTTVDLSNCLEFKKIPKILQKSYLKFNLINFIESEKLWINNQNECLLVWIDSSLKTENLKADLLEYLRFDSQNLAFLDNPWFSTADGMLSSCISQSPWKKDISLNGVKPKEKMYDISLFMNNCKS